MSTTYVKEQHEHEWRFAMFEKVKNYVDQFGMPNYSIGAEVYYTCINCHSFKIEPSMHYEQYDYEAAAEPTNKGEEV